MPLLNASRAALPPSLHGSGSGWFATPFLYDSFIHYFTPVYPDANQTECLLHKHKQVVLWSKGSYSDILAQIARSDPSVGLVVLATLFR